VCGFGQKYPFFAMVIAIKSSGRGLFFPCVNFWQDLKKMKDENRKSYCILSLSYDEIIINK